MNRGNNMYAIKAIYDGNYFKPQEPVPVKGKYEVVITFTKPINTSQEEILKYFGTWDDEDVNIINEIIEERANFSLNRDEI
jgi:predicted DNA-binding antitoxin AbrB/MazE fold protein